jgi:putative membrane protein
MMTLPFGYVFNLGYYVISSYFHLYVLASLELIAEEIEDPLAMMPMIYPLKDMRTLKTC